MVADLILCAVRMCIVSSGQDSLRREMQHVISPKPPVVVMMIVRAPEVKPHFLCLFLLQLAP